MVNRTKYVYDGFMIHYAMREQIRFTYDKSSNIDDVYIESINRSVSYTYKDICLTDLRKAIEKNTYGKDVGIGPKNGYPEIEDRTVRKRLKKGHAFIEIPTEGLSKTKRRRNGRKPYKLHPDMLLAYLSYLLALLTRNSMSNSERYLLIPQII